MGSDAVEPEFWQGYYQSPPRQLVALSRYLQACSMDHLKNIHGHKGLRLSFEPYMYRLGIRPQRITELAEWLSVSKQACNQGADKLQQLGYLKRQSDASDGRAKLLVLTSKGQRLLKDAIQVALQLDSECEQHIGKTELACLRQALRRLCNLHQIQRERVPLPTDVMPTTEALLMLLPRLGDLVHREFLQTLMKQDKRLKPSHLECFTLLGGCGGQARRVASLQGVSNSAVTQLLHELVDWGYLNKDTRPELQLSDQGRNLLAEATACDAQRAMQWQQHLGEQDFAAFVQALDQLYQRLQLAEKMLGQRDPLDGLLEQLRSRYSHAELQQLGQRLLAAH